jgi:hypothetical protein
MSFTRDDAAEAQIALSAEYTSAVSTPPWQAVGIPPSGMDIDLGNGILCSVLENGDGLDVITVRLPAGNDPDGRLFCRLRARVMP